MKPDFQLEFVYETGFSAGFAEIRDKCESVTKKHPYRTYLRSDMAENQAGVMGALR